MSNHTQSEVTLRDVYDSVNTLRTEISQKYVSKDEFIPVKLIVFGMVGTALMAVLSQVLAGVVKAW